MATNRTKQLTKKDRKNLTSGKWIVFERSIVECMEIINKLRPQAATREQLIRLKKIENRIRRAFHDEHFALGWTTNRILFNSQKARTRLSLESV